ncbi:MAG: tetratricopeptide repeat protein, partial [Anaerolineales bacterium]
MSTIVESTLEDLRAEIQAAEQSGDQTQQAASCIEAGRVLFSRNQYQDAAGYYQQASQLCIHQDQLKLKVKALNHLGVCWIMTGEPDKALNSLTCALESLGPDPEPGIQAAIQGNLGLTYSALQDHKRAFQAHKAVMETAEKLGDESLQVNALINLADCSLQDKSYRPAQGFALVALDLAKKLKSSPAEMVIYDLLGMISSRLGDLRSALDYHQQAWQAAKEAGSLLKQGIALANQGLALEGLTDLDQAASKLEEATEIFSRVSPEYL